MRSGCLNAMSKIRLGESEQNENVTAWSVAERAVMHSTRWAWAEASVPFVIARDVIGAAWNGLKSVGEGDSR